MRMRLHTTAAIVVLVAAAAWVATGEYSFVGSEVGQNGGASPAEAAVSPEPLAEDRPDNVQTVAYVVARPRERDRGIRLSGQTEADKQVVLVARSTGAIAELTVQQGDALDQGTRVMVLDGPEKYAAVEAAETQYETAVNQADSNQRLRERGTLPELQLEASIAAREAARSALETARAEVDRLEVRAPFAGVVDEVFVEVGSWVQPGTEVASVLALDPIVVVGEVSERDLRSIGAGTPATVTFGDGRQAEGEVRYVRHQASGLTRTFPIEVAIDNPEGATPSGMSADIVLSVPTDPAVLLPRSAVTLGEDGSLGVMVLTADDVAAFLQVAVIDDTPDGLVVSGIPTGTRIIVSGQAMVGDGQRVNAVAADATPMDQTALSTGPE